MPGGSPVGTAGSNPAIRELPGGLEGAEDFFGELTNGWNDITPSNYPGTLMESPGGGVAGLRPASKSGPPTIDVNIPGIPIDKIKFL
jgi:hypothetical protein